MALVKFGNGVESMRGQFGGVYFTSDSSGHHIQSMPRNVRYAREGQQQQNINNFTSLGLIWAGVVAIGLWVLWVAYAAVHWWITKRGDKVKLTGWNWFVHWNMKRLGEGEPPILIPPED